MNRLAAVIVEPLHMHGLQVALTACVVPEETLYQAGLAFEPTDRAVYVLGCTAIHSSHFGRSQNLHYRSLQYNLLCACVYSKVE